MQTLLRDLRYATRSLIRQPLFTLFAVLTLALGIGANTAVFSVVNAVLLRPLPYPEPDRLVLVRERSTTFDNGSVSLPNYQDWREGQRAFTDLVLVRREQLNVSNPGASVGVGGGPAGEGDNQPVRVIGGRVSSNFLAVLGVAPALGRDFNEADDQPGSAKTVILGDGLWRRRFGGLPGVLGQRVMVDGEAREIIGVAPAAVRFPRQADLFIPLAELRVRENVLSRDNHPGFSSLGRLKPGVTLARATAELDAIAAELERRYPDTNTGRRVNARLLLEASVGAYRESLFLLLGAVGCVLLIACANAANLQLTRSLARGKESAVRAALGASRWRLARQHLTESLLLAALGAAGGVLLALWGLDLILALSPAEVPRFQEVRIDLHALGFTAAVAILAGVLAGLWPAWRMSNADALAAALRDSAARGSSGGARRQRASAILVVAQVALAVVLLAGGGLTLKSFWHAQAAPIGFDPRGVLTMTLSLPEARYAKEAQVADFYARLLERVRGLPGVVAAGVNANAPFDDNESDSSFHLTGTSPALPGQAPSAEISVVSADYFRTLNMPILRGRTFGPEDAPGQPRSVIIDDSFVRKYFAGKDPIGQHIDDNQTMNKNAPPLTVVGVVPRTRNEAAGEDNVEKLGFPQMYFYIPQEADQDVVLLIRAAPGINPMTLAEPVRREVQALDPELPVASVATMEQNIAASLAARRLTMALLSVFAGLALTLASVGLYGVMTLNVTQRTREMGIRLALGAARGDVFRLVLRQGMALVGIGLGLGLLGALGAGRALQQLLFGVGWLDVTALMTAMGALALVAFVACWLPARRATRVDPIVALRDE